MTKLPKGSLCGCMMDVSVGEVRHLLQHPGIDLIEWRMDVFIRRHSMEEAISALRLLTSAPRHPVLATNRPTRMGGSFDGEEELRVQLLRKAVEAGAEWVDLEQDIPDDALERFGARDVKILLSHHDFSGTPDRTGLRRLAQKMAQRGTDAIKIATYAQSPEDNLRVLELIPFGRRELGLDVVAFCMGPLGRWSRFACLLLGSPWTYVQLPGQSPAAPGQFAVAEMRAMLEIGGWGLEGGGSLSIHH